MSKRILILILILVAILLTVDTLDRELEENSYPEEIIDLPKEDSPKPKVAIIIDDLGNNFSLDKEIEEIPADLTLAILPFRDDTERVAQFFKGKREIILHLPLEPISKDQREEGMILTEMEKEEIEEIFRKALEEVPQAVGVNNHKGSLFTSKEEEMKFLLSLIKEEDLFFVDSFTSGDSLGFLLSKEKGIETKRRDIFLDNSRDKEDIREELYRLVSLAKEKGEALAIGHSFRETITVLKEEIPDLKDRVDFVEVSKILE